MGKILNITKLRKIFLSNVYDFQIASMSQSSNIITILQPMKLELLPVELLLCLFDYFSTNDLLKQFYHLNFHFDSLLLNYVRSHGFNFRSISKIDFDTICLKYLPNMANQIASLGLSDCENTPGQTNQFFKYGFTLSEFTHLKSLSLYGISSEQTIDRILSELSRLDHLTYLIFKQCSFAMRDSRTRINAIWSLVKLRHCCLENSAGYFLSPTVTSSSIRSFSSCMVPVSDNDFTGLLAHTPNLRHFSIDFSFLWTFSFVFPSNMLIKTLEVSLANVNTTLLMPFLQQLHNLRRLKLRMQYCFIYGEQWEQIIKTHLPNLLLFQFRMKSAFEKENNREERIDEILDTFRSPFWLKEHRWYVRCDWSPDYGKMYLYTVPYAFQNFTFEFSVISKSTYPRKNNRRLYDLVRTLTYKPQLSKWSIRSQIQFFNIHTLSVEFPISDFFYSMVPNLCQLMSLDVWSNDRSTNSNMQLQVLLDRSPNLLSLRYRIWPSSDSTQMPPYENRSTSVRYLDLRYMNRCYDNEQCIALGHSPLGRQCEILSLSVKNENCIFDLANTMDYLRTLNIAHNSYTQRIWSSTKDELIKEVSQNKTSRVLLHSLNYLQDATED
ncbi:hypothetical protein I4U23_004716 [Adineta vaga]|nr:hypothetical protein I4U23_004716 [Adineta vaga]